MFGFRDECGVMGVIGDPEAANLIYLGLYALQHRGQEAAGIVTFEKNELDSNGKILYHSHKSFGLVGDGFSKETLEGLRGDVGIGHTRYSTTGGRQIENIQPFYFRSSAHGQIALAHNGNLTNASALRDKLEKSGSIFSSSSDTEVFSHLLARSSKDTLFEKIEDTIQMVKGGFSIIVMGEERLYAARDAHGLRPLVIGKRGEALVLASETCALDLIDAEYIRDVEPGEVVMLTNSGEIESRFPFSHTQKAFCSFEPIYFSRPDSRQGGTSVYNLRKRMGEVLAQEFPVEADLVMAIPDSGVPMAIGYSHATGIPIELGLIRNHYVGRTFIEPSQAIRDFGVKLKLNAVEGILRGKTVVVIDDSIVRGTTSTKIVRMLRRAGVKRVHFRIGSPPITHSCFYGVSTPDRKRLLAAQIKVEKIRELLDADSLAYLSIEGLRKALGDTEKQNHCMACFTGDYPVDIFTKVEPQPTDDGGPGISAGN